MGSTHTTSEREDPLVIHGEGDRSAGEQYENNQDDG